VFVDIASRSYTMDVSQIERVITKRTKAILPVHLYGQPADMDPILEIASRKHLVVIEDAAQAHGAEYQGRRAGSIGDLGCFSFYPTKNLGACGEGGMVVTNRPEYDRKIRLLRDWGQEKKYYPVVKGYNYRMEGLQGAILRVKLRHLETWTEARRAHAVHYNALLSGSAVQTPQEMNYARHVYHVYAIRTPSRVLVQQSLLAQGIQSAVHYPFPIHVLPAYADLGYHQGDFPQGETAAAEQLSLPMYPELPDGAVNQVVRAVIESPS
jgi:dTDP-4-amino-4,6-dideoxygalactose transaminase